MSLHNILSPYAGWAELVHEGMRPELAFDEVARRAAEPDVQSVIARFAASPAGRHTLAMLRRNWGELGFPQPWDNVLVLPDSPRGLVER